VLVYFTDLYGTFPDEAPPFPTVWITEDKSMSKKVPFGEVVVCNPSEK
jgi:predicted metal-dependent peptidase